MIAGINARQFSLDYTSTTNNGIGFVIGFSQPAAEYAFGIASNTIPAVGTNTYAAIPLSAADTAVTSALATAYREIYSLLCESAAARYNQPNSAFGMVLQVLRIQTTLTNFNGKSIYVVENNSQGSTFTVTPIPLNRNVTPTNFQTATVDVPMQKYLNANLALIFNASNGSGVETQTVTFGVKNFNPAATTVQ